MIEASEHFYQDDPNRGPRDVATRLRGVNYFFLGNGLIQAAVQHAPEGDGTPAGLLVMNPDRLRQKRAALTMDAETGLAATRLRLRAGAQVHEPDAATCAVRWVGNAPVPTVAVTWATGGCRIEERFSCPDLSRARVLRQVTLRNPAGRRLGFTLSTGVKRQVLRRRIVLPPQSRWQGWISYTLEPRADRVRVAWERRGGIAEEARTFWRGLTRVRLGEERLDHFFAAARAQLPTAVSRLGCVDGSIWQYNHEWLRDQSVVALALTMLGATRPAQTMFTRLLDKFVTPEGDTLDSSLKRAPSEVELDQNGYLLCTLRDYVLWTGDLDLVRRQWAKVTAVAEFPLQPVFRHAPSGLLMNCREFWERHAIHGIQPGLELSYQLWVSEGLAAAAVLARLTGQADQAGRWDAESARLRRAMLHDRRFRLHDHRGFIKRRAPDGRVQETIAADPACGLPAATRLMRAGPHRLNPDSSAALPIALGVVAADSPVARRTLHSLEQLWNQAGNGGGYGRYNMTSEPDSPGGWPFASLFVARAAVEAGDDAKVRRILGWLDTLDGATAGAWFEFYGERIAPPLPQVGIVVWNWAELVVLYVQHILGVRPEEDGVRIRPRLLAGLSSAEVTFTIRGRRRRLRVTGKERGGQVAIALRGAVATKAGEWRLRY
ncbi:MAG: hypothetical protein QG602_1335 [Verrucomicrobiota bacterium]|nr:hypothetical protein [Verrucomicrobiota bacterium]